MLAIAVAGKEALLGHYRGTEPMSKTLFLSASIAFSRLGHKAMFTGLSATPYRRGPVVEGRIFGTMSALSFALRLLSKAVAARGAEGARKA